MAVVTALVTKPIPAKASIGRRGLDPEMDRASETFTVPIDLTTSARFRWLRWRRGAAARRARPR